jgi:hypothetical protein
MKDRGFHAVLIKHINSSAVVVVREFVPSNDKPLIVAYRYNIEASIDVPYRHAQAVAQFKPLKHHIVQARETPIGATYLVVVLAVVMQTQDTTNKRSLLNTSPNCMVLLLKCMKSYAANLGGAFLHAPPSLDLT